MEKQKSGMIVIQPADKNPGLVIMNREDYITEANRQLNDSVMIKGTKVNHYSKTNDSILTKQIKQITDVVNEGLNAGYISKKTAKQLIPAIAKAGKLYLTPKMHKTFLTFPKCRPIISGSGSSTERISWFCDIISKHLVPKMKSYIQDTPDLLRYFEEINNNKSLPQGAKPFALDIKSMYSNIPTNEGLNAFRESLNTRSKEERNRYPTDFIMKLLKIVLEGNIFEFNQQL